MRKRGELTAEQRLQKAASGVIACVDASSYQSSVCDHAAWFAGKQGSAIEVLHVRKPDSAGDEQHSLEVLGSAAQRLADDGSEVLALCSAEGDLVRVVRQLSARAEVVVIGRRDEASEERAAYVAPYVQEVVRATDCAVCVAPKIFLPINRVLVLRDSGALDPDYGDRVATCPWLDGLSVRLGACRMRKPGEPRGAVEELVEVSGRVGGWDTIVIPRDSLLDRTDPRPIARVARATLSSRFPVLVL